jgi:hypothetical protein
MTTEQTQSPAAERAENAPETGDCCEPEPKRAAKDCCGGAPEANADACCAADERAKAQGGASCGCS